MSFFQRIVQNSGGPGLKEGSAALKAFGTQVGQVSNNAPANEISESYKMQFGMNMLFQTGVISEKLIDKLKSGIKSVESQRLMMALEQDHIHIAREIAFNEGFKADHTKFLVSGVAVQMAIENGHTNFAQELIESGWAMENNLLIDAIRDGNEKLMHNVIINGFYIGDKSLIVDFWYLIYEGYLNYAKALYDKEKVIQNLIRSVGGRQLERPAEATTLLNAHDILQSALNVATARGLDKIACLLISINPIIITIESVFSALKHRCIEFLRRVWIGDHKLKAGSIPLRRHSKSILWETLNQQIRTEEDKKELIKTLDLSNIVQNLLADKRITEAENVISWPGAADEPAIVYILVRYGQISMARKVLDERTIGLSGQDLEFAIENQQFELAVEMLKFKEARTALLSAQMQEKLMGLLKHGETCLPVIEMLNRIPNKNWHVELTKELCLTLTNFAKKKNDIIVCSGPLLFCTLVAEFMKRLSLASLQYQNRCISVHNIYMALCLHLEDAIREEVELKHYLTQTDSRRRTVLTIMSDNRFYSLLENDDIETIVTKMWNGPKRNYGIVSASTLYKSFHSPAGSEDAMAFSREMDKSRPYMFHFEQWKTSCSLRYNGIAVSTVILLILYQMVIYTAIEADSFEDVTSNDESLVYLRIAQFWITGIMIEHLQQFIFGWKTKRGYKINNWRILDFVMFLVMVALMLDLHKNFMGPGEYFENIDPIVFNACLHSIMMIIQWMRIMSVLITSKHFGPFLRMIYLIVLEVVNFLVIYFCLLICAAGVFTAMFNNSSVKFADFNTSMRTLFSATLNVWDIFEFDDNEYLGGTFLAFWEILSQVILLNILIALLSNVFGELNEVVDSEHSSVVIAYYNIWHWDDRYGAMIFLPSPFTYVTILFTPFIAWARFPKRLNNIFSKIFYFPYALVQFVVFLAVSLFYFPLLYIKGFAIYGKTGFKKTKQSKKLFEKVISESSMNLDSSQKTLMQKGQIVQAFNLGKAFLWLFIGIFWLFFALLRDCKDFWSILYQELEGYDEEKEQSKVQTVVTEKVIQDFQLVLKNIQTDEVTCQQFAEMWALVDENTQAEMADDQHKMIDDAAYSRKAVILEYLHQFANTVNDPTIDVKRMKRTLKPMHGKKYDKEYLKRAHHVNIHWLTKGVRKYHVKVGSVVIAGLTLPKDLGVKAVKQEHLDEVDFAINKLREYYEQVVYEAKGLREAFEAQRYMLEYIAGEEPALSSLSDENENREDDPN